VLVTGAAGQIAYSLLFSVAKGDVFGLNQVRLSDQCNLIIAMLTPLRSGCSYPINSLFPIFFHLFGSTFEMQKLSSGRKYSLVRN